MPLTENYFAELAKIDVSQYVEKKGQFSYLSWAWAIDQIKRYDPEASWNVKRFPGPNGFEIPYMIMPKGCFVEVEVTVKGNTVSQLQPIMDFKNKAMIDPDAMDVNKAIQRCLVKGIASHGLGLYIYAGEDLPNDVISAVQVNAIKKKAQEFTELRGGTVANTINHLGIKSLEHLPSGNADIILDKLQNWIDIAKEQAKEAEAAAMAKETAEVAEEVSQETEIA